MTQLRELRARTPNRSSYRAPLLHGGVSVHVCARWALLKVVLVALLSASCDDGFAPLQPTDLQFSVTGYLDAGADIQWIRVMPIRPLVLTSPTPLGARVTLENLRSGDVVELEDSVFRFSAQTDVGSDGVYLHNFWTTKAIEPSTEYRFTATWPEGQPAESVVQTPSAYDVQVWIGQGQSANDRLRLEGVTHLPFVIQTTHYFDGCGAAQERIVTRDLPEADPNMIAIHKRLEGRDGCGVPQAEKREILIVASAAEWPSGEDYATFNLGVTELPSNVSNAVGFIGGVFTRRIPYEDCRIEDAIPAPTHCVLRYDETSAVLTGAVRDVVCGGTGVPGATVELREIESGSAGGHRVRFTRAGRSGAFEIGGLQPGSRYAMRVRHVEPFEDHTDTLRFRPGERAAYQVPLRRSQCGP